MMKRFIPLICAAAALVAACAVDTRDAVKLSEGFSSDSLNAPWDSLVADTRFDCRCEGDSFRFRYVVRDSALTLTEPFTVEQDVNPEDRVEFFFCPDSAMSRYWCAEIDPLGRVMDYEASFYRNFDMDWNFSSLRAQGIITADGYEVSGTIALEELAALGIGSSRPFWMGVFQADFKPDGSVVWYSLIPSSDEEPDFHKPGVFFKAVL